MTDEILATYPYALELRNQAYDCQRCSDSSTARYLWIDPNGDVHAMCQLHLVIAIFMDISVYRDTTSDFWWCDIQDKYSVGEHND